MPNPNDPDERRPGEPTAEGGAQPHAGEERGATPDAVSGSGEPPGSSEDPQRTLELSPDEIAHITGGAQPSDTDDPLVGTVLRNKWRVLGRIGAGSFGTVYKVQDVKGKWIEALKILSVDRLRGPEAESAHERFLREARIMKRLGTLSPHIVALSTYEDDIEAGLIYFLMEHVEGRVLADVLLQEGPLSVERTTRIGLQICDALVAAHESEVPVVHRDLKLENIMLTHDPSGEEFIKVLDFGIAKLATKDTDSRLTATGTLGTPGYAAPEQLRAGEVDARTDLFALGVILYSLVTGRNPWLGHLAYQPSNQTYELMAASDRGRVIPVSEWGLDVPRGMIDIIMKLLRREPEARFQSARELRDALYALGSSEVSAGGLQITAELRKRQASKARAGAERRLAAVWFADLVGYSTLSSQDEVAALALLDVFHRTARRVIEEGGGRVVQFIGDAAFAEFTSTERAVRTAREFLAAFKEDTAESPHGPKLRIGAHVGDVLMAEDGDLFGDGVNVAARIQNEAEPDQIVVTQDVWRQLRQRRDFGFVALGERALKGIGTPVSLFAVVDPAEGQDIRTTGDLDVADGDPTTDLPAYEPDDGEGAETGTSKRRRVAGAVFLLLVLVGGGYAAVTTMTGGSEGPPRPQQGATPSPRTEGGTNPGQSSDGPPEAPAPDTDQGAPDPQDEGGAGEAEGQPTPVVGPVNRAAAETPAAPTAGVPATPADETPEDPFLARYGEQRTAVFPIRTQALSTLHAQLESRLEDAETLWNRAATAAGAGRYQQAAADLASAGPIYEEVISGSELMRQVDEAKQTLGGLRADARDAELRDRADSLERTADDAVRAGRYQDALDALGQAATLMIRAAEAPPVEVAMDVLERLKAAMEARDLDRVRQTWTSMTDSQVEGYGLMFDRLRELAVRYEVESAERQGSRVVTTVELTFLMPDNQRDSVTQRFELAEVGPTWVIVASSLQR